MSRFFTDKFKNLVPYTPGEQPKEQKYIKLNTNESPYPPSPAAIKAAREAAAGLNLYSDPECRILNKVLSELLGVNPDEILATNGSDEILNFAFAAFCDDKTQAVFPDITYGFYPVFANINRVKYETISLEEDFTIDINKYKNINKTIFIANPNAPTGIALAPKEIEEIIKSNPDNVVVIDEAYVDFGAESCVPLIHKYDNLLVTRTFSKSCSMAGARLGFGVGCSKLIADLNTIKYSTNPYNINSMTMAAGVGTAYDSGYVFANCREIAATREYAIREFEKMGFSATNSKANFIFVKSEKISGKTLYEKLKENRILVRHFDGERISEYNRITIGTKEQTDILLKTVNKILEDI